jgi:competence protein ComEC
VQTAHHTMLYDAGPAYNEESDAGQRIVLPYLRHMGVSHLDTVVISHDDNDHSGGMASVLAGVSAGNFLSSLTQASDFFKQIQTLPNPPVLRPQPCYQGQQWQWDNISFRMLSPEKNTDIDLKDNDKSCVLQVKSPHGSLLLTGDIEKEAERRLLASGSDQLATTVMTMPHHGSKTSSTIGFVNATKPAIAIATVGYLNRFGHPKPEVISRYQAIETTILRSDNDGAILIDFLSGQAPVVKRWRQIEPHYWEL